MDIKELESFKLSDAVKFHDKLNPLLWTETEQLDAEVRDQLLEIAKDFIAQLGLSSLKVEDITISGSNAAYSYTPHSDIDLHIIVDFNKLPEDDVYRELFNAKKTLYNDTHNITVHGVPVELYVQDSQQPHVSLGEYSLLKNEWIKFPKKRRANFDQIATRLKYEKLGELIELALKTQSLKRVLKVLDIIKRYRKAGLDKTGEFGPENLAFKALRKQGYIQDLWDLKQELHSKELSLEDYHPNGPPPGPEFKPTMPQGTVKVDVSDVYDWYKLGQHISDLEGLGHHDFGRGPPQTILSFGSEELEHKYLQNLKKLGLDTHDIDPGTHSGAKKEPEWGYRVDEVLDPRSAFDLKWETHRLGGLDKVDIARTQDAKGDSLAYTFWYEPKYNAAVVEFSRGDNWNKQFAVSGAGEQFRVYATLLEALRQYLAKNPVQYIMFSAKDPSQAKLYRALSIKYISAMGYDLVPKGKMSSAQALVSKKGAPPGYKSIRAGKMPPDLRARFQEDGAVSFVLSRRATMENHNDIIQEDIEDSFTGYRGVGLAELKEILKTGHTLPSTDLMPFDNEIIEYSIGEESFEGMSDQDVEQWIQDTVPWYDGSLQSVKGGVNFTTDKFNAQGYGDYLIGLKINGPYVDFSDVHSFAKNYKDVEVVAYKKNGTNNWIEVKKKVSKNKTAATNNVNEDLDYMAGHCHVMALALKQLHPDWQIRAHIGWDEESEDDDDEDEHRVDHVYIVAPDGSAYDCRGRFDNEQELVGPDETGGVDTQFVDYSVADIKYDVRRGELKPFTKQDILKAIEFSKQIVIEASGYIPSKKQANDPRFKTALTVDIKPDSIQKNAEAFGFKVSRSGKPPLLRK